MSAKKTRILGFERLEPKATPTSLLMLLATDQVTSELPQPAMEAPQTAQEAEATNWTHQHRTADLLRFISHNTSEASATSHGGLPTEEECQASDEMMKLEDDQLQGLVFSAVFGTFDSGSDS